MKSFRCVGQLHSVILAIVILCSGPARAQSFGPELNLSQTPTDSETGLSHQGLAFDAVGTLHVVWAERDGPNSNYRIYSREFTASSWTPPQIVVDYLPTDPGSNGGAKYPAVLALDDGTMELFWHDYRVDGINNVEIFTKHRGAGAPWPAERTSDVRLTTSLHPESGGDNGYVPTACVTPSGEVCVAWYDFRFDGNAGEILTKSRPAAGSFDLTPGDAPDLRITSTSDHDELAEFQSDSAGNLHAAWRTTGSGSGVAYSRRDAALQTWSAPTAIDGSGQVVGAPAMVVDSAGRVHVVWPDARDGGRALFTRVREPNGSWGQVARITRPAHAADEPTLAADGTGQLHLAWHDGRVSLLNREVFYRKKSPAAPWDSSGSADVRVSSASGSSTRPSLAVRGGAIAVIWKDARDGNNEIYFRVASEPGTGIFSAAGHVTASGTAGSKLVVAPNPAFGSEVSFSRGNSPEPLGDIAVFDLSGRVVRRFTTSSPRQVWDLRDDTETRVTAGVYFVGTSRGAATSLLVLR